MQSWTAAGAAWSGAADSPPPDAPGDPGMTREWRAPFVLDLPRTAGVHARGHGDPAFRVTPDSCIWRTSLTPEGPGTLRIAPARPASPEAAPGALLPEASFAVVLPEAAPGARPPGATSGAGPEAVTVIRAAAWGPGAAWLLRELPALLGGDDDRAGFAPAHPVLRELSARHPGVRVGRSGRVLEALVPAVLEQKVVGVEARRAWSYLLLKFGDPAPGPAPAGMRVPPPPAMWRRIPSWEWHRAGVEGVRARTIIGAAEVAGRLEEIVTMASGAADRRLRSLPGIGVWTSAEVRQRACGDADAVSVGDYHLPSAVGWALAGRVVDDAGMLELLAPYAGHRHRAARLVELAGIRPPRRGPRMSVRDYRAF
jgi:3-methyladenine DNA glycosylase/8-oxoguanine DNA glycosylase